MKTFWWIVVIVVIGLLLYFGLQGKKEEVPAPEEESVEAPTASVSDAVEGMTDETEVVEEAVE